MKLNPSFSIKIFRLQLWNIRGGPGTGRQGRQRKSRQTRQRHLRWRLCSLWPGRGNGGQQFRTNEPRRKTGVSWQGRFGTGHLSDNHQQHWVNSEALRQSGGNRTGRFCWKFFEDQSYCDDTTGMCDGLLVSLHLPKLVSLSKAEWNGFYTHLSIHPPIHLSDRLFFAPFIFTLISSFLLFATFRNIFFFKSTLLFNCKCSTF